MREIDRVLEIALYVEDMGRAVEFYRRVFRFAVLAKSTEPDRLTALDVGKTQVLLLSKKGASVEAVATPGGKIPPCDGGGNSHLAFPIETSELKDWEEWLARKWRGHRKHGPMGPGRAKPVFPGS